MAGAPPPGVQKAQLTIPGAGPIPCLFNPENYTISKKNNWTFRPVVGATQSPGEFGGGDPQTLSLKLLLDASLLGPSGNIKPTCTLLMAATQVPPGALPGGPASVPPLITFIWGAEQFTGVCTSLSINYQMFQPNGAPIRAEVSLDLTQASATIAKPQNPTTQAVPGLGTHTLVEGDTLQAIAFKTYGDPNRWRAIAEANGIDDPFRLPRGAPLLLPKVTA